MLRQLLVALSILVALAGLAVGNDFYTHGSFPSPGSPATSASMRAEMDLISAGFDKLPTFAGNANKPVVINGSANGLTVAGGALSLAGNLTIVGAFPVTLTATNTTNLTLPTGGALATLDGIEILTHKTLITPSITAPSGLTSADVGLGNVDNTSDATKNAAIATLLNKQIINPVIQSPLLSGTVGGSYLIDGTYSLLGTYTLAGTPTIADNVFRISYNADLTRKLAFNILPISTGTTRTITPPNADLTLTDIAAAGDLVIGSAPGVQNKLPVGAAGSIPMSRTASTVKVAYVSALTKAISGCTYANAAGDVTNDLDLAACNAMDATGAYWITAAALTKQLDVNWAVGTGAGGLDTGAIGNSDYYIWAIARSDTGVTDYLFSLSSTAPTMPANYDFKRLIGWFKRVGGVIVLFHTYETEGGGLEFLWTTPTLDIDLSNTLTTSRRTDAVKVPLNFSVVANLNIAVNDAVAPQVLVYCPDQSDLVPSTTAAPLSTHFSQAANTAGGNHLIRTSAVGLIAARSLVATTSVYKVSTMGFTWARRN